MVGNLSRVAGLSEAASRQDPEPRFVVVHSLTAHGVVGLKAFLPVLGELCLPVPSLLLSGPGDMPGCQRHTYDFAGLLESTFAALAARRERVVLFVGYVAGAEQIDQIAAVLARYRKSILAVCVDPIGGDDGRAYVSPEIIAAWPRLLEHADWALPNRTELELLTQTQGEAAVAEFLRRFSRPRFVVTGWPAEPDVETRLYGRDCADMFRHGQQRVAGRFNGTGDLFAATFLRALFVERAAPEIAVASAACGVARAIQLATARGVRDLSVRATA